MMIEIKGGLFRLIVDIKGEKPNWIIYSERKRAPYTTR